MFLTTLFLYWENGRVASAWCGMNKDTDQEPWTQRETESQWAVGAWPLQCRCCRAGSPTLLPTLTSSLGCYKSCLRLPNHLLSTVTSPKHIVCSRHPIIPWKHLHMGSHDLSELATFPSSFISSNHSCTFLNCSRWNYSQMPNDPASPVLRPKPAGDAAEPPSSPLSHKDPRRAFWHSADVSRDPVLSFSLSLPWDPLEDGAFQHLCLPSACPG